MKNVMMPLFIPKDCSKRKRLMSRGSRPEVAWVTHGGEEKLAERLCVRPTSETLFCDHYRDIIQSYRDLPKLYNQWCSVVRWKRPQGLLRTTEFFWQEGHTMHETAEEAMEETVRMLNVYADFCEQSLQSRCLRGGKQTRRSSPEPKSTYTIEAMMHDGKALQSATSHYFGDGFARAFDIQFTGRDNTLQYPSRPRGGCPPGLSARLS